MAYRGYCTSLNKESGFGALMGKLQRALSVAAHQDDLVVKYVRSLRSFVFIGDRQIGKRCQRRKDGKAKRDQLRSVGGAWYNLNNNVFRKGRWAKI